jgi:hypothetical protein
MSNDLKKGCEKLRSKARKHLFICIGPDCCETREGEALWDYVKRA